MLLDAKRNLKCSSVPSLDQSRGRNEPNNPAVWRSFGRLGIRLFTALPVKTNGAGGGLAVGSHAVIIGGSL
jgi:hypothetical protein